VWLNQVLNADAPLYNIGGHIKISGAISSNLFECAWNLLVQKHDALRTILVQGAGEDSAPMQIFVGSMSIEVPLLDLSGDVDPHASAVEWTRQQLLKPFALYGQKLFNCHLLKVSEDIYYSINIFHHLIADGWSIALLGKSLGEI
jgi:Condensation domain